MNQSCKREISLMVAAVLAGVLSIGIGATARASDHLDSPMAISNPQADIGDVYAWISPNGRQLNLIMDIVGKSFSDKFSYAFHIDSGKVFGKTTATTSLICRFYGRAQRIADRTTPIGRKVTQADPKGSTVRDIDFEFSRDCATTRFSTT